MGVEAGRGEREGHGKREEKKETVKERSEVYFVVSLACEWASHWHGQKEKGRRKWPARRGRAK